MNETATLQATPSLKKFFEDILDNAACDAQVGGIDHDGCDWWYEYETNCIYLENDEVFVEGSYKAAGTITESGDGYWEPRETSVSRVSVEVEDMTAYFFNPETEDYDIEASKEEINELCSYLEKHLPSMLED